MFVVLLTCTQFACAARAHDGGLADAALQPWNELGAVLAKIERGMSKKAVFSRLANVRCSGHRVQVHWENQHDLWLQTDEGRDGRTYYFYFRDEKLDAIVYVDYRERR